MSTISMAGIAGLATIAVLLIRRKKYDISYPILICICIFVGVAGYFGAALSAYLAFGNWLGIRFYGRALLATITLYVMAKIFRKKWCTFMNYYAPVDIIALIVMKTNCLRVGCCSGIVLFGLSNGQKVVFPSQIVEFVVAVLIIVVILFMGCSKRYRHYQYSFYLTSYGLTRFVFDYLREEKGRVVSFVLFRITVGQIFCVILTAIGITVYFYSKKINSANREKEVLSCGR